MLIVLSDIYPGDISISETGTTSQQLFEYMLQHAREFNMRVVSLVSCVDDENDVVSILSAFMQIRAFGAEYVNIEMQCSDLCCVHLK